MNKVRVYYFVLLSTLLCLFSSASYAYGLTYPSEVRPTKINAFEIKKEARAAIKEEIQADMTARKEAFREKLAEIKDENKRIVVERINDKIANINERRTTHMTTVLEKLEGILARIKERTATAAANGKDVTNVNSAIDAAQRAIDAAKQAVNDQKAKEYVVSIETEETLRTTVGSTVSQLQADLRATHKLVVDAKQAVMQAARLLAIIVGATTPAPSATPTP